IQLTRLERIPGNTQPRPLFFFSSRRRHTSFSRDWSSDVCSSDLIPRRGEFEMAQYQITVDSQLLHQLFLSNSQDAGVAKLLESVLNQVLQAQATEQLGAEPYERTEGRQGYRNGTYP